MKEWFAKSGRWVSGGKFECDIKPEALRYTVHQFEYWGRKGVGALSALQIERGETEAKREYLRRLNSIGENFATVNGSAFIDSTSTDVTLVSVASRQTVLMAPWRTEVLGAGLNYIFGTHVTFDSPSNMTALLAILHAAEDKVAFCARFGITIEPRDWYSMTFHRILGDNGDPKGKLVEQQVSEMETGTHYGMTNDAINKSPQESNHRVNQRHVDHKIPGTTHGRRPGRGEPRASETARWNYFEYMLKLIKHALYHNNVEQVPQLLTLAMRRDGVEPTRRGILEWMMARGYVSSAATDLNSLRVRCLPRLKGVIHADGIHIFNPWEERRELIVPKMCYRGAWLMRAGLLEAASKRAKRVDVHLDPMNPQQAWVNLDGLRPLQLHTNDPDMLELTLLDWCRISSDDKLIAFLDKAQETRRSIEDVAENNAITAHAQRELNAEIQRDGKKTKTERNSDRRHTTAVENAAMTGRIPPARRGASKAPVAPKPPQMLTSSVPDDRAPRPSAPLASSPLARLIDEIR